MAQTQDARYGTMSEVLTRINPELRLTATSRSLTYPQDWWPDVVSSNLSEWKEFSYENLISGWGHILEDPTIVKGEVEEEIPDSQRSISDEDKVDSIVLLWNIKILREPLKLGAQILRPNSNHDIVIDKHKRSIRTPQGIVKPDMAIFYKDEPDNLVMGENKTSNWKSTSITRGSTYRKNMMPLRQITAYCMAAKTRYGWLMSDHELLVCRVSYDKRPDDPTGELKTWRVEYRSIPWKAAGPGALTVNLSIWWLGMMGISEKYRGVVERDRMMPINFWWEDKIGDRAVGYTV